jgi:hypothetical protein
VIMAICAVVGTVLALFLRETAPIRSVCPRVRGPAVPEGSQ